MMDKNTRKIVASIVAIILVVAMVLPLALSRF